MEEIRAARPAARATLPMLSVPVKYAPCPAEAAERSRLRCGAPVEPLDAEWIEIGSRISRRATAGTDADAMHASAVLDLITGAPGNSLGRSISYLEMTSRMAPTADRFVDLSAAYLVRAERDDDTRSVVRALDAALRAKQLDSTDAAARFNLALAMRELGLLHAARRELLAFEALEPKSPWTAESREFLQALAIDTIAAPSEADATESTIAAFARKHPAEARAFSWDRLAAWSKATDSGHAEAAERHLRLAEAAGLAIQQTQSDPAIADAAAAIRKSHGNDLTALARAHGAFARVPQAAGSGNNAAAYSLYMEAARLAPNSPALVAWATFHAANNLLSIPDPRGAERILRDLLASPAAERYPALRARVLWTLGVILLRTGRDADAVSAIERSRDLYGSLGEPEFHATLVGQLAEAINLAGDSRRALAVAAEALRELEDYPLSNWRHNTLMLLARVAASEGYTAAAATIEEEDDTASRAAKRLWALAENRLTAARRARAGGDDAEAARHLAEGLRFAAQLPPGRIRNQLERELSLEEVDVSRRSDAAARESIDLAIAFFDSISNYSKLLRAYTARAALSARTGNVEAADRDLDRALAIYEERREGIADANQLSLMSQQARRVADALTLLRIGRGDARGAMAARERARAARPARVGPRRNEGLVVELALIGDTLVTLTARGDTIETTVAVGDGIRGDIELARAALERAAPEIVWVPPLERLHARLIAPLLPKITAADSVLTIIADDALGRVPFAALRDRRDGRYLIEKIALRFATSLRQGQDRRTQLPSAPRALLVADPVFDRRVFPALRPLAGAGREIDSVGALLPQSRTMRGATVDTTTLKGALEGTEVFHFAGHALFDDSRPDRSQLVIGSGGLTAASIARMHLPSLRLVVLSACETDAVPSKEGAGLLGLTESFIAAGAGGVVGSLWKVDDEATRQLMQAFYAALARTRDPATALRDAQRSMSGVSPRGWAAFRYAGK